MNREINEAVFLFNTKMFGKEGNVTPTLHPKKKNKKNNLVWWAGMLKNIMFLLMWLNTKKESNEGEKNQQSGIDVVTCASKNKVLSCFSVYLNVLAGLAGFGLPPHQM
ncbi:hypothetical protein ILYODFUR_031419 [Ilyodon furcidens]|uniref:Transmembrane protein n=1 Tax=Ilyodon furcidens TaxID=33524 RepID=A0ABV0U136_9TELE